ncbi:XK-related protein 6-like isoform X1 [Penaeus japonicus]|uniref:XK-related protein 6-like isoform X1 n=1 Tax=Penaeus japonicus TaxID=27405 RepID=UPI001C714999|nr:XK-related protein 6-like isoform X1 [Penaeus japonicus]XP_042886838.1 XK-related protein 6-like isoform X1 [Penaeus japonicus]
MKTQPSKRVAFSPLPSEDKGADEQTAAEKDADGLVSERPASVCKFTWWNELVIWFSMIFYVADLCLDLWVCVAHFEVGYPKSGWFIFFCILLPNLYAGYKSLQWYLRAHAITPLRRPLIWIIRVIFFPISPLLRYIDALMYGAHARQAWRQGNLSKERKNFENYLVESAEVAMLRLVIIFLEDAPIVVLNLTELIKTPPSQWTNIQENKPDPEFVRLGSVVAKLACTMTLGVVHYMSCNKLAWHLANTQQQDRQMQQQEEEEEAAAGRRPKQPWEKKGVLSWPAEVAIYCWQLLSIGSRVVAYALFSVVHFRLLWVPIMLRWMIHSVWIFFDVREMSIVNSIAFGGVYLFSFVTTSPGRQILRILLYYVITFGENIIIGILWSYGKPDNYFQETGLALMFGGAAGGLLFLMLYYGCCHPDRESTWGLQWLRERRAKRAQRSAVV